VLIGRVWPGIKFQGEVGRSVRTDERGIYRLTNLEPGRYKVTRPAQDGGSQFTVVMETREEDPPEDDAENIVTVNEGQVTVKDIVEAALATIEGVVQTDTGRPLQKQVNLSDIRPGAERRDPRMELPNIALSDETGAFSFKGLEPGTFKLTVGNFEEKLTVAGGETRRLQIQIPVFALEGTVVDGDGKPFEGAQVYAQRRYRPPGSINMGAGLVDINTDDDGRFKIEDLVPGTYTVAVYTDDQMGVSAEVQVGPDETVKGLRIVIEKLVRLRVTVKDAEGEPVQDRYVALTKGTQDGRMERTSQHGIAEFRLVPGKYQVEVLGATGTPTPDEITLGDEPQDETVILR
jgi:protocatechuate 3,4-dioxygenase beta subunit